MGDTRKMAQGRSLRALTAALVLALFAALLLAGSALAVAAPGKPTAKTPEGAITSTKPIFAWGKAARATSYEVRAYKGSKLLAKKTGITKLSWASSKALPNNVSLTWKVRAWNAGGSGAWSTSLTFKVVGIGTMYQGGKIAYVLHSGDPGYIAGQTHGLIAAPVNQSAEIRWYNGADSVTGATATALGAGLANTRTIISAQGTTAISYAAGLARAYRHGGYSDWYLPSLDELNELYLGRAAIGGFGSALYWSSSEGAAYYALAQDFSNGFQGSGFKDRALSVRAVRSF